MVFGWRKTYDRMVSESTDVVINCVFFAEGVREREEREENPRYIADRVDLSRHKRVIFIFIVSHFFRSMRSSGLCCRLPGPISMSKFIKCLRIRLKMAGSQRSSLQQRIYSSTIILCSFEHSYLHAIRRGIDIRTHSCWEREEQ